MTAVTTVQPGEVLNGTYRLERLIGSGGMGMVFEASHMRVPRKFAIKVLNPEAIGHRDVFERFQREAEIASGLGHEHIAHVFDFNYTPAGMPYMVLEYLEGHDLGARLRQEGRLSIPATLAILSQVGAALDAAHVGRMIHRDLKPTNIFLWRRGPQEDFVKILDFGISKIVHASSSATRTGLILGTPNYMAPEQAEGRHQEVDHRVDLFALGAIAYECLTGRMAFDAPTPIGTMYQVCHSTPPPIRAFAPQVTEAIERVVARAMAKSRDARYPTSAAMLADLAAAAEGLPTDHPSALPTVPTPIYTPPVSTTLDQSASQKVTPLPRPLRRGRRGAIAVALALVAGGAIAALLVTPAAAPPRVVQPIAAPAPAPPVVEPVRLALPPPVVERFELVGLGTALAAEVSFEPGEDLPALPQLRLRAPPKSKAKPKAKPAGRKPNLGPVEQSLSRRVALILCLLAGVARADEATSKRQASALFAEGNRLLQKGDYAGALELYRGAYEKYRSPKILLNMGAALRQLGRPAEALEMYERYLADPEADARRTAEVTAIVRELEPRVATLEITVDQAEASVSIDGVAGVAGVRRVNPGKHTVAAARPGFVGATRSVTVTAGARYQVALALAPAAPVVPLPEEGAPTVGARASSPGATRLGALVRLDVDTRGGVAGLVGISVRLAGVVELTAAAILGPSLGGYAGGAFMIGRGAFRPRLVAGVPILAIDGEVAPGVHLAAGLQWRPVRSISVAVDFGVQHFPTLDESAYWKTLLMPSLAVAAWF